MRKIPDIRTQKWRISRRKRSQLLNLAVEALESRVLLTGDVTTIHADQFQTGAYTNELVLTPGNVNSTNFGRQFMTALDGQIYAQPLAVGNVNITRITANGTNSQSTGIHNVLYVATMHNSLYAVDADNGKILWQDNFCQIVDPRVTTLNSTAGYTTGVSTFPEGGTVVGFSNTTVVNAGLDTFAASPEIGIFGTPYIDKTNGVLYLMSSTMEWRADTTTTTTPVANGTISGTDWHFVMRIWAVNLSDGAVAVSTPSLPSNTAPMPTSGGGVIGDTVMNPTTYAANQFPPFNATYGYQYYAGPYIKGSGDNDPNWAPHPGNVDGWVTNPNDTVSPFAGSVPSSTSNSMGQCIAFNAIIQGMRVGMCELNGVLYASFTSHGDRGPYYGWILGVDASTLQVQSAFVSTPTFASWSLVSGNAVFKDQYTPYNAQGAIWGGEQGVITDGTYLYAALGNGAFNWTTNNFDPGYVSDTSPNVQLPMDGDFGNSWIKIAVDPAANQNSLNINSKPTTFTPHGKNLNGYGLKVADFFTPSDILKRNYEDWDVGSSGITLIPDNITSTVPGHVGDKMMFAGTKEGKLYLIDRDNMGGFNTSYFSVVDITNPTNSKYDGGALVFNTAVNPAVPKNGPDARLYDRALGEYLISGANPAVDGLGGKMNTLSTPAFFVNGTQGTLINIANGTNSIALSLNTLQYTSSPPPTSIVNPTPIATGSVTFGNSNSPVVSQNGTANSLVWLVRAQQSNTNDDLLVYNATLGTAIYDSNTNFSRDSLTGRGTITGLTNAVTATKFSQPAIFNGMAYIGTGSNWGSTNLTRQGGIVGYGLLSSYLNSTSNAFFGAPTGLSANATGSSVSLAWTLNSTLETHIKIERSSDNTNWTVINYTDTGATSFLDTSPQTGQSFYRISAINGPNQTGFSNTFNLVTTVAGRWTFYNNSGFDTVSNDNAVATDKSALLPSQNAAFANYTSFDKGINGIMVDISGPVGTLSSSDFTFLVGNSNSTASWTAAVTPLSITERPGFGTGSSTRFDIVWADNAIQNQWLRITVKGGVSSNSGLAADDSFFFGNAIGEAGNDPSSTRVDAIDQLLPRGNATSSALITNHYDYNRDGAVNASDETVARTHASSFLSDLVLITGPVSFGSAASPPQSGLGGDLGAASAGVPLTSPAGHSPALAQAGSSSSTTLNVSSNAPAPKGPVVSIKSNHRVERHADPRQKAPAKQEQALAVPAIKKPASPQKQGKTNLLEKLRTLFR